MRGALSMTKLMKQQISDYRDLVKQVIVKAIRWGCDFPDEVIFSERYNDSRHSDLLSSEFHERVQGMFDHAVLRTGFWRMRRRRIGSI